MITIWAEDGEALSNTSVRLDDGTGNLVLVDVDQPDALLRYYFGRGGSRVTFELAGQLRQARLSTRWGGNHRVWFVRVEPPALVKPPAAAPREGFGGSVAS